MTQIDLRTAGRVLSTVKRPTVTSGDHNSVRLKVQFDPSWAGYTKSAVFHTDADHKVYEVLLVDDACLVPAEVLTAHGTLFIGVRGVKTDSAEVKPSTMIGYWIKEGAPVGTATAVPPTPDVYQQLLARIEALERPVEPAEVNRVVREYLAENPPSGADFQTDETLSLANGILSVNTADVAEADNTLPITSAAVHTQIGNIEVLLRTV